MLWPGRCVCGWVWVIRGASPWTDQPDVDANPQGSFQSPFLYSRQPIAMFLALWAITNQDVAGASVPPLHSSGSPFTSAPPPPPPAQHCLQKSPIFLYYWQSPSYTCQCPTRVYLYIWRLELLLLSIGFAELAMIIWLKHCPHLYPATNHHSLSLVAPQNQFRVFPHAPPHLDEALMATPTASLPTTEL